MAEYQCAHCSKDFIARPSERKQFCSHVCWAAFHRAQNMHVCQQCGKSFYRDQGHAKRAVMGMFCSRECFSAYERQSGNPVWDGGLVEMICPVCNQPFFTKRGRATRAKYCSVACYAIAKKGSARTPHLLVTCETCRKEMSLAPSHAAGRRFCSKECKDKSHAKAMQGGGNPRYVHGECISPYHPRFGRKLKKQIKERDQYRCRVCGRPETVSERLHVHHIDYDKNNTSPGNLILLCKFCHGQMHGGKESRKQWKHELCALLGA